MPTSKLRIGILGGGQLARMLLKEAVSLDLDVKVLSAHADDPAAQIAPAHWTQGSVEKKEDLKKFFKTVDVVTFESEFISPEAVAESASDLKIKFRPSLDAVSTLRHRETQKQALVDAKIATSPFISPKNQIELIEFFENAKRGIVLKKKLFGYDGFGTFIVRSRSELDQFMSEQKIEDYIAEERVIFRRELAISLARDTKGQVQFFPIVEWKARNNQCWWVKGPIVSARAQKLKKDLKKFASHIDYCGLLTFELFETSTGLLINEVAPRVHNSAHHSIDSMSLNQFQAHLVAVSGRSLKAPSVRRPFAMVNLVGSKQGPAITPTIQSKAKTTKGPKSSEASYLHWYGKKESRPGRKMGHVTVLAKSADAALKVALKLEKSLAGAKK